MYFILIAPSRFYPFIFIIGPFLPLFPDISSLKKNNSGLFRLTTFIKHYPPPSVKPPNCMRWISTPAVNLSDSCQSSLPSMTFGIPFDWPCRQLCHFLTLILFFNLQGQLVVSPSHMRHSCNTQIKIANEKMKRSWSGVTENCIKRRWFGHKWPLVVSDRKLIVLIDGSGKASGG